MHLLDIYRTTAADRGSDAAITFARPPFEGVTLSWSDLIDKADSFAEELSHAGIGSDSRVATMAADHPNFLPALLATWQVGGIPIICDPLWGESIQSGVITHSRADAILRVDDRLDVEAVDGQWTDRPDFPPNTGAVAYTSGSTAAPKGIPLRHDRLVASMYSLAGTISTFCGETPRRMASSMRLSGAGVLGLHYFWPAAFGAEVVVLPPLDLETVGRYWADIDRYEIDQAVLVSVLYEVLLRVSDPGEHERRPLFLNASGPIPARTHERFMERFDAILLNCYGLTETTFACMVGDTDHPGTTTRAVGRPGLVKIRLRAPDGSEVIGAGEGELEVSGPTISDGYYDNDEANENLFNGIWLRTGDVARRDETGKYWIVGRLKDAVMKGGSTVYLTEVEEACVALDGVLEAAAVRADMPGGIEDLGVIVRTSDDAALDSLQVKEALDRALGSERSPRKVVFTDRPLPYVGQQKIDRRSAQELWAELTG